MQLGHHVYIRTFQLAMNPLLEFRKPNLLASILVLSSLGLLLLVTLAWSGYAIVGNTKAAEAFLTRLLL